MGDPIDSLIVERQINSYLNNKKKLKKGGVSLLRRLINITSRMNRKPSNFQVFKRHILNDFLPDNDLVSRSDLQKIYNILNSREKQRMMRIVYKTTESCWYTNYLIELRIFCRKNRLPYRDVSKRITYLNNFYGFVKK